MMKLRELNAGLVDMAYDQEVRSTPQGRASLELREQAQRLRDVGQVDEALDLFQQALALFDEQDDGAAAAAARHDLGTTISKKGDGPSMDTAERLLERARRSPARERVPRRISETENSLAICLRQRAEATLGKERRECLERAASLYRGIIWRLERSGLIGMETLANTHLNLGNVLRDSKELEPALREYEHAARTAAQVKRLAQQVGDEPSLSVWKTFHYAHLTPAGLLRIRGRAQDLREAERLLARVLVWQDPEFEPLIRMEQAELYLAGKAPDRIERAWEALSKVREERLPKEHHLHLAHLMRRAGAPDAALERLQSFIRSGIGHRARSTISDFDADAASHDFQRAAALAARIYIQDKQQSVSAFLVLENASGLRFNEMLSWQSWHPQTPLAQALHALLKQTMNRTGGLDGAVRMLELLEPRAQKAMLTVQIERLPKVIAQNDDVRYVLSCYEQALHEPVPYQALQRRVDDGTEKVRRLRRALQEKDMGYEAAAWVLSLELDAGALTAMLREEPGQVFLRFSLEKGDLLVISVWLEGDTLQGRSTTLKISGELMRLLSQEASEVDFERLSSQLAMLDLSAVFPSERKARAVLLPSYWASALPLAALGPRGSRLIDHFASIVWLPSLAPLRARQAPHPPRSGHLVVIPETTRYHRMALRDSRPGERRLEGSAVTRDAVMRTVKEVETLCIYAHGSHRWGTSPVIKLRGQETLDYEQLAGDVRGMERVENWACESGTNRPVDPMTPPTDDAFGLDFRLLMYGARSAIGTLWKVPDLVTATIVRHYRRQLAEGLDAARALASAQRWWDAEGLPRLLSHLGAKSTREALAAFSASLGIEFSSDELDAPLELLGPVSSPRLGEAELKALATRLSCPVSWAGLRFVGLPERRPLHPWMSPETRPMNAEEQAEFERLLKREPPPSKALDDLQEEQLADLLARFPSSPTVRQAIAVARRMRERLHSSLLDNVLLGLAWLHEALATPELAEPQRIELRVEAAHLWLDVAEGEQLLPSWPDLVALARAEDLLARAHTTGDVDVDADALAARARLRWMHTFVARDDPEHGLQVRRLLDEVRPLLARMTPGTYASLRVATVTLELLRLQVVGPPDAADAPFLAHARKLLHTKPALSGAQTAGFRLRSALDAFEADERLPLLAPQVLTARELTLVTLRHLARHPAPPRGSQALGKSLDEVLSVLEGRHWGYAEGERQEMLRSVGTPGAAYRRLLASYVSGHARGQPEAAAHELASLQFACDLRVGLLHRLSRLRTVDGETMDVFDDLWRLLRGRQALHTALVDAALLPHTEDGRRVVSHARDPYALPVDRLLTPMEDLSSASAWCLGEWCTMMREQDAPPARTTAFEVARASAHMERSALQAWEAMLQAQRAVEARGTNTSPVLLEHLLSPELRIQSIEDALRQLPPGHGVLGLCWTPGSEHLLALACWNDGSGVRQRSVHVEARTLRAALYQLLLPREEDTTAWRGHCAARHEAWEEVERGLAPVLESLLVAEGRPALHWGVLAPGGLRALPLLGLRVRGQPLAEQVLSLVHLPHLGFGFRRTDTSEEGDFTVCLLARDRRQATTQWGEAAVETLRRAHPPQLIADAHEPLGERSPEVGALHSKAERLHTLRLYGTGGSESVNDTLTLLRLEHGQPLRAANTFGLFLPRCEVVELWACTAGSADLERLHEVEDRIPGLADSFLSSGATAVLDVAWPVPDLVKALVCEQYGLLRCAQGHGPDRLVMALRETRALLGLLKGLPDGARGGEVLTLLDELRRVSARQRGIEPARVVAFASATGTTALEQRDAAELIPELCHPSHLGAFRWWGV